MLRWAVIFLIVAIVAEYLGLRESWSLLLESRSCFSTFS